MIDRHQTPGEMTEWVMEPYEDYGHHTITVSEVGPDRASAVLGPDGEPYRAAVPRHRLGFDLSRKS